MAGAGDLADIARICAADAGVEIVVIVDPDGRQAGEGAIPVASDWSSMEDIDGEFVRSTRFALRENRC